MKALPLLLSAASAGLLSSCVDPYMAGEYPPPVSPVIVERQQPVLVERHRYAEERSPVVVDRYRGSSYQDARPYYGDPAPGGTTYRRTTTRTYQDY